MSKVLIIVDCQHDFTNPDGALFVSGAPEAVNNIAALLESEHFDQVVFTLDWHPVDHCSFKENGGIWPMHCVAYSEGAGIDSKLEKWINGCTLIFKGYVSSEEEYGAYNPAKYKDQEILKSHFSDDNEYIICGVAGDYCVLRTIENILKINPSVNLKIYLDGIASIDNGETLEKFIRNNNLKI